MVKQEAGLFLELFNHLFSLLMTVVFFPVKLVIHLIALV